MVAPAPAPLDYAHHRNNLRTGAARLIPEHLLPMQAATLVLHGAVYGGRMSQVVNRKNSRQAKAPAAFIILGREHKSASSASAEDSKARREAERRTIATRYHERLVKADLLRPVLPHGCPTADEMRKLRNDSNGCHLGDAVIRWAAARFEAELPGRHEMLHIFREDYGLDVQYVNEDTMRRVRQKLAPETQRKGGQPTHRRTWKSSK
jgi:hypothetical protein